MYTSTRQQNLSARSDWRNSDPKRAISPIPDEPGSTRQQQPGKYGRRPLPYTSGSVAALQQHHQRLMQQQDSKPSNRSVSPLPTKSSIKSSDSLSSMKQYSLSRKSSSNDLEVVFDDDNEIMDNEEEGEDVEEERMVVIQDNRARSPSINRGMK